MGNLTFLVKPASSLCGMRCRYCFYEDISALRSVKSMGVMSLETANRLLESGIQAAGPHGSLQITFQGGEPTLAGLDFFQSFIALERELCPSTIQISHSIQTNGMALDGDWVRFFQENRFLVGLSLDGSREIHDRFRVDAQGRGSWDRATRSLALLDKAGVETNLLCVITGPLARSAQKVYHSLNKLGSHALQFIPCLDPLEGERGCMPWSLTPQRYSQFLRDLFDCWYLDLQRGHYVSIRLFDDYLRILAGMPPSTCASSGACGSYLVVEGDGGLYPCDFFVLDQWYLGNIHQMSVEEAVQSPRALAFLDEGRRRPRDCLGCPHLSLCRGGCPRDWTGLGLDRANYYCPAFHAFLDYALPRLRQAAGTILSK